MYFVTSITSQEIRLVCNPLNDNTINEIDFGLFETYSNATRSSFYTKIYFTKLDYFFDLVNSKFCIFNNAPFRRKQFFIMSSDLQGFSFLIGSEEMKILIDIPAYNFVWILVLFDLLFTVFK